MKRIYTILISVFLFTLNVFAQHCPWDYSKIFVLRVVGPTNTLIPNLKITVLDSLDKPVLVNKWNGNTWIDDTLRMEQNPAKTTHKGYIDNENPVKEGSIRFWFALDNYILVDDFAQKTKFKLRIEDVDGEKNGKFKTSIIKLDPKKVYPLCNHFSQWSLGPDHGFVKGYEPMEVVLAGK